MRRFIPWLILLFPALELLVLIQVGKEIGALGAVGLVLVSMFAGFALLRLRGMHIAKIMRTELAAGRMPSGQILDTFCLMAAGWLFIFPGFISDILAILLVVPGVRRILPALAAAAMRSRGFSSRTVRFESSANSAGSVSWTCATYGGARDAEPERPESRGNAVIIDCEPEVVSPRPDPGNPKASG